MLPEYNAFQNSVCKITINVFTFLCVNGNSILTWQGYNLGVLPVQLRLLQPSTGGIGTTIGVWYMASNWMESPFCN